MNKTLKSFVIPKFPDSYSDASTAFVDRSFSLTKPNGFLAFISPYIWMFNSSYEKFRLLLEHVSSIESLIQLEYNAFEPACVPVCTFTVRYTNIREWSGTFVRLSEFKGYESQAPRTLEAIQDKNCSWRFTARSEDFAMITGRPIAYWVDDKIQQLFASRPKMKTIADTRVGLQTSDNDRFVRFWHEVDYRDLALTCTPNTRNDHTQYRWCLLNKGGPFRKWYGNYEHVVNWLEDGKELKAFANAVIRNEDYYFREAITWSDVTSSDLSMRFMPVGFIPNNVAHTAFFEDERSMLLSLALSNTPLFCELAKLVSPSMHFSPGYFDELPYIEEFCIDTTQLVKQAIYISRNDWNLQEASWDFDISPLLKLKTESIEESFRQFEEKSICQRLELKAIEEELNERFLNAADVIELFNSAVSDDQITLYRPNHEEDTKRLISYAVGCMMGRYSLDKSGLIYAHSGNQGFDSSQYQTFPTDDDGIIPITDDDWFLDGAANRVEAFIATAWPKEHLAEDLKFVAESLGPNRNEQPRETIRRYLATGFFKHHLSMYKRRPIYWLFSSGKQRSFQCLVYLHRYHEGTLSRMRTEYVIPLQGKIASRIAQLADDITAATSTSHRKRLEKERDKLLKQQAELQSFDEKLRHYADRRISLDLDDGVKVNYGKFGDLLADVKAVTGRTDGL